MSFLTNAVLLLIALFEVCQSNLIGSNWLMNSLNKNNSGDRFLYDLNTNRGLNPNDAMEYNHIMASMNANDNGNLYADNDERMILLFDDNDDVSYMDNVVDGSSMHRKSLRGMTLYDDNDDDFRHTSMNGNSQGYAQGYSQGYSQGYTQALGEKNNQNVDHGYMTNLNNKHSLNVPHNVSNKNNLNQTSPQQVLQTYIQSINSTPQQQAMNNANRSPLTQLSNHQYDQMPQITSEFTQNGCLLSVNGNHLDSNLDFAVNVQDNNVLSIDVGRMNDNNEMNRLDNSNIMHHLEYALDTSCNMEDTNAKAYVDQTNRKLVIIAPYIVL